MNKSGDDDKNIIDEINNTADPIDDGFSQGIDLDNAKNPENKSKDSVMAQYIKEVKSIFAKDTTIENKDNKSNINETKKVKGEKPSISVSSLLSAKANKTKSNNKKQKAANAITSQISDEAGKAKIIYAKRTMRIWLISGIITLFIVQLAFSIINHLYFSPPSGDSQKIEFVVEKGSSISEVADLLYKEGYIKNTVVFKLYAQFTDTGYKLKSGRYELSKNMTMSEILDQITRGVSERRIINLTITEGKSIDDEAKQLTKNGLFESSKTFFELINNPSQYAEKFVFIKDLPNASERKHYLEGYLFPDTYEIYADSSEDTIIQKQLTRFRTIFSSEYEARAQALGLTMDQVVTLASIIEKEAKTADFKKVSAVFHNRLKKGMALQSCATVQYAKGITRLNLTDEDTNYNSPYNTYLNKGLPIGPICSPGKKAIEAALYPDDAYLKGVYLYFCVADPTTGATVFSKTYEEHLANVDKYRPLWQAYDEKNAQ